MAPKDRVPKSWPTTSGEQVERECPGSFRPCPTEFLREGFQKSRKDVGKSAVDEGNEKENANNEPAVKKSFPFDSFFTHLLYVRSCSKPHKQLLLIPVASC